MPRSEARIWPLQEEAQRDTHAPTMPRPQAISRRRCTGVPEHALYILHGALLLGQRGDRSSNHLKCQLRQFQVPRQLVEHPLPIVVRVQEAAVLIREDEGFKG